MIYRVKGGLLLRVILRCLIYTNQIQVFISTSSQIIVSVRKRDAFIDGAPAESGAEVWNITAHIEKRSVIFADFFANISSLIIIPPLNSLLTSWICSSFPPTNLTILNLNFKRVIKQDLLLLAPLNIHTLFQVTCLIYRFKLHVGDIILAYYSNRFFD